MQLKTLILEDFLSYKSETVEFPTGLVAVVGHNHDSAGSGSNGGGKSALFDAVTWAIYGKTLRDIGTDDVIRIGEKACEVALSFELDGETYFIQRKRSRSTELVFLRGQTDLSQSQLALTQEKIDQTIGMDYAMFRTVATFQGDALRFANATDKEQKEILEKLMGLEDYAKALDVARRELNQIVPRIAAKVQIVEQEKGLLKIRAGEILKLQIQQDEARRKVAQAVDSIKDKVNACNENIARNNGEILSNKHLRTQCEANLAALGGGDDSFYRELAEAKSHHRFHLNSKVTADREVARLNQELARVQARIGTPCGECARKIEAAQVEALANSLAEKIIAQMDESTAAQTKIDSAAIRVNELEQKEKAFSDALAQAAQKRNEVVSQMQNYSRRNDLMESENRELTAVIENHRRSKLQMENEVTNYDGRIKDAQKRLDDAEKLIAERSKEIEQEQEQAEYLKFWEKGFGFSGIRSMLLDGIAEKLTEETNRYLKILSSGTQWCEFTTQSTTKDGEMREKFAVKVFNQHGAATYAGNSAGERKRVDIAVALALHNLARHRASRCLGFAIMDELFECLDEMGCESVVNLLRTEKDQLGTIFVVSHNPAMGTRFGATIEVAKKDGITSIVHREKATAPCAESKPSSTSTKKEKSSPRSPKGTRAPKVSSPKTGTTTETASSKSH